ncbi:hypothetical protein A2Z33_06680 [Candidatus Gottesmanbacteria bacterium RBG_16_52_11]|uniref:Uncharacterized protein n=1 Tax=Candidatus Gottesmanbacteria bacterium RBG_16_52_11 TaxID=1798374 RepID=A0A1F5YXP6_9BACT|nr:MAG: hypothetical protein A2Z33_06680 [Candidatus Gottesmanbacteria bacterium RBG_16_52_11]
MAINYAYVVEPGKTGSGLKFNPLAAAGVLLAVIVLIAAVVLIGIGRSYGGRFLLLPGSGNPPQLEPLVRDEITKITVRDEVNDRCIEFTRDGAARIYEGCEESVTGAARLTNTRTVSRLFKLVSESDARVFAPAGADGCSSGYSLIIHTATGRQEVCLAINAGFAPGTAQQQAYEQIIDDITGTVDDLLDEIIPTPTAPPPTAIPTLPVSPAATPSTGPTTVFGPTPSPTPTVNPVSGFTCEFTGTGTRKPYIINDIMCSSKPTPYP